MEAMASKRQVFEWLDKVPFEELTAAAADPTFSYEDWFEEGR